VKTLTILIVFLLCAGLAVSVQAGQGKSKKYAAKAFVSDPEDSDEVVSAWITHAGLPDAGKSDHALYMQKSADTTAVAYAGAKIRWLNSKSIADITELGFDYLNGGHCTAAAPRFVIQVDGVDYNLGCTAGVATPAPDDVVNWTRVRFGPAEFATAGIPVTGTITDAMVIFDEGTDAGTGTIYLDNIDINGALIGKPGKAKAPRL
jgi:hypothetical protein